MSFFVAVFLLFGVSHLAWPQQPDPLVETIIRQVSRDSLESYIKALADANGYQSRVTYTEGNRWAASYLKQKFASFEGLTSVRLDTFFVSSAASPHDAEPLFNVVATLRGREDTSKVYVIGGHFDSSASLDNTIVWSSAWPIARAQGADDNASGVAAVLECARILSDPANNFMSKYTIEFVAFGAEERHPVYNGNHLGSFSFVKQAFDQGVDILGVYNIDMIGYNNTGHDYFSIVSDYNSQVLGEKMLAVNATYQIGLQSNQPPFPAATYSDHERFWTYRYKAILLIENAPPWENNLPWYGANPFYHTQRDTYEAINLDQVEKVTKLTVGTVAELAGIVTAVQNMSDETVNSPDDFVLHQNYPNPFNGRTLVKYRLKSARNVRLRVFDILGQELAILVQEHQQPGDYAAVWDGEDFKGQELSSGVYLYVLEIGDSRFIRKMIFSK